MGVPYWREPFFGGGGQSFLSHLTLAVESEIVPLGGSRHRVGREVGPCLRRKGNRVRRWREPWGEGGRPVGIWPRWRNLLVGDRPDFLFSRGRDRVSSTVRLRLGRWGEVGSSNGRGMSGGEEKGRFRGKRFSFTLLFDTWEDRPQEYHWLYWRTDNPVDSKTPLVSIRMDAKSIGWSVAWRRWDVVVVEMTRKTPPRRKISVL